MKKPMWDSKAVKAYETGQGVELVNEPYPHYIPNTKGEEHMTLDCVGWFGYDTGLHLWFETNKGDDDSIPLYKEPPQREWVGLTEEEVKECFTITPDQFLPWHIYKRIEAKLKEKNT